MQNFGKKFNPVKEYNHSILQILRMQILIQGIVCNESTEEPAIITSVLIETVNQVSKRLEISASFK